MTTTAALHGTKRCSANRARIPKNRRTVGGLCPTCGKTMGIPRTPVTVSPRESATRDLMDGDPTLTRRKAWRLAGNDARVWRWVIGVALTFLVVFVAGSTWAWLQTTGDVAAENAFGILVGMGVLFVFLPAFIVFEVGLVGLATHTKSKLEQATSWVVAFVALAALAAYIVESLTI